MSNIISLCKYREKLLTECNEETIAFDIDNLFMHFNLDEIIDYKEKPIMFNELETKLIKLEAKLDLILNKLEAETNPEDLLSQSEIDMMKSWRADAEAMDKECRTNEADNTPTGE